MEGTTATGLEARGEDIGILLSAVNGTVHFDDWALAVRCPTCGSGPLRKCITGKRGLPTRSHAARAERERKARVALRDAGVVVFAHRADWDGLRVELRLGETVATLSGPLRVLAIAYGRIDGRPARALVARGSERLEVAGEAVASGSWDLSLARRVA